MMNLVVSSLGFGGAERVCYELANYYADNSIEVNLYLKDGNSISSFTLNPNVNIIFFYSVKDLIYKTDGLTLIFFQYNLGIKFKFINLFYRKKIKLIVRHATYLYKIERPSADFSIFKRILIACYYTFYICFIRIFDHHIVLNETMRRNLIKRFKIPENKITIIENPLNKEFFDCEPSQNRKKILFIGRLISSKGVLDLLYISKRLQTPYYVEIIGTGPLRKKIDSQLNKNRLNINVSSSTHKVINAYKNALVVVLPSKREGSPNVLLEAIATGVPVVAYDCKSGPKDIIKVGVNGYLVDLGNKEALFNAVNLAINELWDISALKQSVSKHKIEIISKKYLELILTISSTSKKV